MVIPSNEKYMEQEKETISKEYKTMRLHTAKHVKYLLTYANYLNIEDRLIEYLSDIENTLTSDSILNLPSSFNIIDHAIAEFIYIHHFFAIRVFNYVMENPSVLNSDLFIYRSIIDYCNETGVVFKLFDSNPEYMELL